MCSTLQYQIELYQESESGLVMIEKILFLIPTQFYQTL